MDQNVMEPRRLPRPVGAVIFDLDGTLIDTEAQYRAAFMQALDEVGRSLPEPEYNRLIGLPSTTRREMLPLLLGPAFPVGRFFEIYYRRRAAVMACGVRRKPGVDRLFNLLDRVGMPRAIATSASATTAERHLRASGLADRVDIVVTRDDVLRGKPAPDSFVRAADLLGVDAGSCLAVEDSDHGVQAAYDAGMMVMLVPDALAPADEVLRCSHVLGRTLHDVAPLLPQSIMQPARQGDRSRLRV